MLQARKIRRNIARLFFIITTVLMIGIGLSVYFSWQYLITSENEQLERNASITSIQVTSTLFDASKVIEVAHIHLEQALTSGNITPARGQQILEEAVTTFSVYNRTAPFGLMLLLDRDGKLIAQNKEVPKTSLDLSDRYYFYSLKNDPARTFSIGPCVITRTTGRRAFHLSMSLKDPAGNFAGVIAIQIQEEKLTNDLHDMLNHVDQTITTFAPSNQVAFYYPSDPEDSCKSEANNFAKQILPIIEQRQEPKGWINANGLTQGLTTDTYVGFAYSPHFKLHTIAVNNQNLLYTYLSHNWLVLLFAGISICLYSFLFIRLYLQARHLEQSRFESLHDQLTGLPNRRALDEVFERLMRESMRTNTPISVLFMDIDHFKRINDQHGHDSGDRVLTLVADTLKSQLQRPMDMVCRWGGEEFVAILPKTDEAGAINVALHIMERVRTLTFDLPNNESIKDVTISIGIATTTVTAENITEDLVDMADKAMFLAKAHGRNCYQTYQQADA